MDLRVCRTRALATDSSGSSGRAIAVSLAGVGIRAPSTVQPSFTGVASEICGQTLLVDGRYPGVA